MRVWRKRRTCLVRLLIVEGEQFHCILGRNACIELGCLEMKRKKEKRSKKKSKNSKTKRTKKTKKRKKKRKKKSNI